MHLYAQVANSLPPLIQIYDNGLGQPEIDLFIEADNAIPNTGELHLSGTNASITLITMNANNTISRLFINGARQPNGTYNSGNTTWVAGAGDLVVRSRGTVIILK